MVGISLWALASGGLVPLRRIESSEDKAFCLHYQLFSVLFWILLVALVLLVSWQRPRRAAINLGIAITIFGACLFANSLDAWEDMSTDLLASLNVRAGLQMMEGAPSALPMHRILPCGFSTVAAVVIPPPGCVRLSPTRHPPPQGSLSSIHETKLPVLPGALESDTVSPDGNVEVKGRRSPSGLHPKMLLRWPKALLCQMIVPNGGDQFWVESSVVEFPVATHLSAA